ncbi:MAG: hypothetical protein EKK55_15645 [Rhodocyclaceae bacterium]|nr:MAG: hypothetical protein EKK55_15645 [Rhodocyclaceae bacterium]
MLTDRYFTRRKVRPYISALFGLLLLLLLPGASKPLVAASKPLLAATNSGLASAAVDTALQYVGERETRGYNRSPFIDKINRLAGVPVGSSWCMASAFFSYHAAAAALGVRNPLLRTASVSAQVRFALQAGSGLQVIRLRGIVGAERISVMKGDVLCAKRGGGTAGDLGRLWPGHVELAVADYGATVATVGGNTSSGRRGSQRDGDGQWRRVRPKAWFLVLLRVAPTGRGPAA